MAVDFPFCSQPLELPTHSSTGALADRLERGLHVAAPLFPRKQTVSQAKGINMLDFCA